MKQFIKFYASVLMVTVFAVSTCFAQKASDRYAILIGGSGWSEEYSAKYKKYLIDTRKALIENFGFSELHVLMLTESVTKTDQQFISMSHAEFIREESTLLAEDISTDAVVFVILFGHGSFDGKHGKFNIPGKDLTDADFAGLIDKLAADRIVFITTTQASFPFIQTLSEKNRIIITATKSGTQKIETVFPEFFVEALGSPASDIDKNGDLSVLEVFKFASEKTVRFFEDKNHLATEHSQLEDTGDRRSFRYSELESNAEGNLASGTYLKRRRDVLSNTVSEKFDTELLETMEQQGQIEFDISELKSAKQDMSEQEYFERLENLLIKLSLLTEELENKKN